MIKLPRGVQFILASFYHKTFYSDCIKMNGMSDGEPTWMFIPELASEQERKDVAEALKRLTKKREAQCQST